VKGSLTKKKKENIVQAIVNFISIGCEKDNGINELIWRMIKKKKIT
jgi:hypothetical protein